MKFYYDDEVSAIVRIGSDYKEITCHFCFEQFEVSLEIGSSFIGKNIEIYDCEICCNPNKLEYVVDNGEIIINNVSNGNE